MTPTHFQFYMTCTCIFFRLLEHIEESKGCQLTLKEVCTDMKTNADPHAVGRILRKVFHSVTVKRERCKDDWTSKHIVYQHINWRQTVVENGNKDIDFKTIGNIDKDCCRNYFS